MLRSLSISSTARFSSGSIVLVRIHTWGRLRRLFASSSSVNCLGCKFVTPECGLGHKVVHYYSTRGIASMLHEYASGRSFLIAVTFVRSSVP